MGRWLFQATQTLLGQRSCWRAWPTGRWNGASPSSCVITTDLKERRLGRYLREHYPESHDRAKTQSATEPELSESVTSWLRSACHILFGIMCAPTTVPCKIHQCNDDRSSLSSQPLVTAKIHDEFTR